MAKTKHAQKQKSSSPAKPASKSNGQAKNQVTKERGALLSFLLVLILVHGVVATWLAYTNLKAAYSDQKTWILVGLGLVSLACAVAAVGMWYWKKWGITLYVVASIVAAAIHLMLTGSLMVVFYDLIPVAILGYVINLQLKRNLFA